jgi:hypothetical protein
VLSTLVRLIKGLDTKKLALAATAGQAVGSAAPERSVASVLLTGGSTVATVVLHDATGATNAVITLAAATGESFAFAPATPVPFALGIYAVVTGTGATALVAYN